MLYKEFNIRTVSQLKEALQAGKLQNLKGFGKKLEEKIRTSFVLKKDYTKRTLLKHAIPIAKLLLNYLKQSPNIINIEIAGSYRRKKETIGDLDIVVTTKSSNEIMNHLTTYNGIQDIVSSEKTRCSIRLRSGMQVNLRTVPPKNFDPALILSLNYITLSYDRSLEKSSLKLMSTVFTKITN